MNLAAKAPPASPRSLVNSCWMASFQANAATSPRANVINSANLSNTSALNFYSSFPTCTSSEFCGYARAVQVAPPFVHLKPARKVEGGFCELRLDGVLGRPHSPGRTPMGIPLLDRGYAHSSWRALSPRE